MTNFCKDVSIAATPETVWKIMIDVENWYRWTSTIMSIKMLNSSVLKNGTRLRIVQPKLPVAVWKVFSIENMRSFFMKKSNWFLSVIAGHEIQRVNGLTIVTLSIEFSGVGAKWIARKYGVMMEEYLSIEAQGLKNACENVNRKIFVELQRGD